MDNARTAKALIDAATAGDFERLRALVASGADVNAFDADGVSVLTACVGDPHITEPSVRLAIARELLSLGADPCLLGECRKGPLTEAMLCMDTNLLRLLLDAGAKPNDEAGCDEGETLFDWALMDYEHDVWFMTAEGFEGAPDSPSDTDRASADAWLMFLDRMAVKHGKRRPDHLFLLRERGAQRGIEINVPA